MSAAELHLPDGQVIALDERGYLLDPATWSPGVAEAMAEADGMDLGDERVGRPYSLVNPPHEPLLEIFFNIVPEGPLSRELAALEVGDRIWLTDAANGFLTLSEVPRSLEEVYLRIVEEV